ncbi:unnamed protein product [Orchesella dallaii]|uniref:Cytochrome b561 domain-containing protein n=1 Tax=Orchesella dallaii TaxID=48710 RepID=A0ABP1RYM2_9HEXA
MLGCSRHFRFRPEIFILSSHNIEKWKNNTNNGQITGAASLGDHRLFRKMPNFWLRSEWFGAADIMHPARGPLQCSNFVVDPASSILSDSAGWIKHKHENLVKEDYDHYSAQIKDPWYGNYLAITCQPSLSGANEKNFPTFAGRCKSHRDPTHVVGSGELHACNTDANSPEFKDLGVNFTKYSNYTWNLIITRNVSCSHTCHGPNDTVDLEEIKNITAGNRMPGFITNITGFEHETRTGQSIAKFWRGRKFHAILWILITMFLNPISFFVARYFKETFMNHQFNGIHIWYWTHVTLSLTSVGLMSSSQVALAQGTESWGRSESLAGKIHRGVGLTSQLIMILLTSIGGWRAGTSKGSKKIQFISMILHSSMGFLSYLLNLALILISTDIPGSPSLAACGDDGLPVGTPAIYAVVLSWLGFDIGFHVALTTIQYFGDKKIGFTRPFYFPIIPVLHPQSHVDMRLSFVRKILLILYLLVTTGFSLGLILHIGTREQPKGCVFGEMSCKAALGCSSAALAMCKKLKYRNCEG